MDSDHPVVDSRPVRWAAQELRKSLSDRGVSTEIREGFGGQLSASETIVVTSSVSSLGRRLLETAGVSIPKVPEAMGLVRGKIQSGEALLATGSDERGLIYALLELADRVQYSRDPLAELGTVHRVVDNPATPIRSVTRLFTSESEDKPWFYDKSFWQKYLSMLTSQRFNRFNLTLGLGYDSPKNVLDSYFYFAYPFLVSVPGYRVSAQGLPDEEKTRNLEMLRWISDETTARGLHFQLGLWTHAYNFIDSPNVNYTIRGLTPETHGAYCREALRTLLGECPNIKGVTMRCHSESGLPEGSYEFWRTVFDGTARVGRSIEIDIHAKGIEHKLIQMALDTGNPVNVSPKAWAEHTGLPYHQAAIREIERRSPYGQRADVESERNFTRYSYADYLREDRKYGVLHRMWPGTQRILLWGDPTMAASASRYAKFCGSLGFELTEPLSRKGQRGSGAPGSRAIYQDRSLYPNEGIWEKYLYTYRLWGRLLYSPDADPDSWRRFLRGEFPQAAADCETALAQASRILPIVTSAHLSSANCHIYWPEIYTNMPIVDPKRPHPYSDSPVPKRFGTVSPLDPAIFSGIEEFVSELVEGQRSGRYSPLDAVRWLESAAEKAEVHLNSARKQIDRPSDPAFRRLDIDVTLQIALGRFFAEKFRSGVSYSFYERTGDRIALEDGVKSYRKARDHWRKIVAATKDVYVENLTFGEEPQKRGHWLDRLPAIEADLADMETLLEKAPTGTRDGGDAAWNSTHILNLAGPQPPRPECDHLPPASFHAGRSVFVEIAIGKRYPLESVQLHYRRVNQADAYRVAEMTLEDGRYRQTIPGEYTRSSYPLLYFFTLRNDKGNGWLYPGVAPDFANQPYFVIRQNREPEQRAGIG